MEQPLGMPSTSYARADQFLRNVFLLKNGDFEIINGQVHMPTKSEMATIRARTEQYKKDVEFNASMSSDMVKKSLEETFPYLLDKGFFCAAKRVMDNDTARFDFDGSPRRWNGRTIKRKIQGNSTLYILENDQMDTSSGVSENDSESSQDVVEMSSLRRWLPWLQENVNFDVESNPNYSPLPGGGPCIFTFTPGLHSEVTSVYARFEGLGTQKLEHTSIGWLGVFPASQIPAVVDVALASQDTYLGNTQVTYGTNLQQVVSFPSELKKFCELYDNMYGSVSGNTENNEGEAENSGTLGFQQSVKMLSLLTYVAAEIGAQQFIKIIFTSSASRVVFNSYKDNSTLPEVIAKDHGYEETAHYLEDITKRFSEEINTGKECSQTIDWSELAKAAERAQNELADLPSEEKCTIELNAAKETGYSGDLDTSSSDASQPQSSESEDDYAVISRKDSQDSLKFGVVRNDTRRSRIHLNCSNNSEASISGPSILAPGLTSSYMPIHARLPTIPSTTEYPGNWSFQISFGPLTESASKSATWTYSDVVKKLYVNLASFCPIKFKTTLPPPPGSSMRAVAVFKGSTDLHDIVKRCPNHMESSNDGSAPNNHFIRSNNPDARYHTCPESSRHSVLLPYNGPQAGEEWITEMFAFMCFSSCQLGSGPSRRPIEVIFTLESEGGQILGRRVAEIRVCACPGRERKLEEKVAYGKRKVVENQSWFGHTSRKRRTLPIFKDSINADVDADEDGDVVLKTKKRHVCAMKKIVSIQSSDSSVSDMEVTFYGEETKVSPSKQLTEDNNDTASKKIRKGNSDFAI